MFVLGLTGVLGSGKSTVARMLARRGGKVIDADGIIHDLLASNKKCIKKVAKIFPSVIVPSGVVSRCELAKIVFKHPCELKKLTNILYPEAFKIVKKLITRYKNESLLVLDAPLLFESGWNILTDMNIVVKAKRHQHIERAQQRLGITRADVLRRMRYQMPLEEKCRRADMIIDNTKSLACTRAQVYAMMDRLEQRRNA